MAGNGKQVQFARGSREAEDAITGLEGEIRVDLSRKELRLHDGQKQGGHRIASVDYVESRFQTAEGASSGTIQIFATIAELKAFQPSATVLAILREEGKEDSFVWQQGIPDGGDIPSDISGYWKRLDGQSALAIQFFRAGIINMQIDGTEPVVNQNITAWLVGSQLKLWNSSAYVNATPATWMRLFASIGGFSTGSFTLPDQLQELLVDAGNLDTLTKSGWYRSTSSAVGNPVPGVNQVEHRELTVDIAIQTVAVPGDSTKGYFIRYRSDNSPLTWTAYTYIEGEIPSRLRAAQTAVASVDLAVESGFYWVSTSAVWVIRLDANTIRQIVVDSAGTMTTRVRQGGVWGSSVTLSVVGHTHDDRYHTEAEVNSLLSGKAALSHTHDDRYNTRSEIDSLLSGKAPYSTSPYDLGSYIVWTESAFSGGGFGSNGSLSGFGGTWQSRGTIPTGGGNVALFCRVG